MNPRLAPHNTRPLRRARTLAALRELDVAIDFGWPIWRSAFIYDHERDGL